MGKLNIHIFLVFLIIFLAVNTFILDIVLFSSQYKTNKVEVNESNSFSQPTQVECSDLCQNKIKEEIYKYLSLQTPTVYPTIPVQRVSENLAREIYIPIGTGSTKSTQWEDLLGAEVYIDTNNYSTIKKVYFETYLRIGTGQGTMYAKLFNVTDKHDVWFSEVSVDGGGIVRREAEIKLESGSKLYRVMAKSTLSAESFVDNARIKIITY